MKVDWESLKEWLLSACPSSCFYKKGVVDFCVDVTKVLCELEMLIQRVKVMPNPDGRVLDLFFITDCLIYCPVFHFSD
ncbi:hypothetical protein RchiOBHm_Chr7g0217131 [Rosa chinensis]|uniref:Uncharacterized protein n=1 Tax=Rosa chinensis TaxID=74649 RepID=A0A2P6PBX9_ROSCH|nr:hypothetical protein RchiOBHm_Chr7g0217131 [Rosa chinensis]